MTDRELMQEVLEVLNLELPMGAYLELKTALRDKLAHCDRCGKKLGGPDHIHTCSPQQPVQEPVACLVETEQGVMVWPIEDYDEASTYCADGEDPIKLYTAPQPRQWQGLTDGEIWKFWWDRPEVPYGEDDSMEAQFVSAVRAILKAEREKNA